MFFVIRTYSCIFVSYWWLFVSFPCKFVHHSYLFRSAVVLSMAFVVVIWENLAVQSYIFLRHSRSNRDRFFLNLIRGLLVRMDTNINSYCIRLCSWCIFVTVWTGHNSRANTPRTQHKPDTDIHESLRTTTNAARTNTNILEFYTNKPDNMTNSQECNTNTFTNEQE